jgi:hypothetical protein
MTISTGISLYRRSFPEMADATSGDFVCRLARWVSLLLEALRLVPGP